MNSNGGKRQVKVVGDNTWVRKECEIEGIRRNEGGEKEGLGDRRDD